MRLKRAVSVWAVVALSLGLFATGASAFRHPSPNGRCRIRMYVVPWRISEGEPVTVFGRLLCRAPASAGGQVVRLFHHLRGVPGFTYVQSTTTDANGFYQFQNADAPVETSRLFHVRSHWAESANRGVRVAPQVTLSGPPEGTQILTGSPNQVTFTGTVNPVDVGARVILQRQNALTGGEWRRIDVGRVQEGGKFSIAHTFVVPGDASLRVVVRSEGRNVPGESNVLSYEISQAQNSDLTIEASANPISYGQSVVLDGTLAGGANQPVTLLAHIATQPGFVPVAQATTDGSGKYAFPAQAPVNSTFYEVQGAGKTSAVLFEGVKYLLAAQVSASTVQAGQTLTFTGSVAPGNPGHVVYVQRRDASGDFHIVAVGALSAQSTFSIVHQVYGTGSQVFRVYVPGGPANEGTASQPFTINVTPAPAAALKPEAPGNTSQPPEGTESGGEKPGTEGGGSEVHGGPRGH
jgi:hypothetical protein